MDRNIGVSVMLTFYNQKQYVKDSLTSVLEQKTSFPYEIICGDDGSTDGTYEELLRWRDRYPDIIKVIRMPRDLSIRYDPIVRVSNCRLTLYGQARGEYVVFLDGDDYFIDCNKLEYQKNLLDKNRNCICAAHPIKMIWENSDREEQICSVCQTPTVINKKLYWSYTWIHADTFMFRNIFEKNGGVINPEFFDDNTIVANFIKYGDILYTPECMVAYRQIEGSSWNMRNPLQRAYVNLYVYHEAGRILMGWSLANKIRSFSDFNQYYINKNEDIAAITGNKFNYEEKFIEATIRYRQSSAFRKGLYQLRYGILLNCGALVGMYRKLARKMIDRGARKVIK